jgi:DNA-binding response OmpR family regulator
MRVLLVEDDNLLGGSIKEYLEANGVEVDWIYDDRLFSTDRLDRYDVIVLDLILRFSKGEELLRMAKESNPDIPILVLTAKRSIRDKEVCFNYGADDYLTKPFEPKELLLRLRALVSRYRRSPSVVQIGGVSIDLEARRVYSEGKELKLSKNAWQVLEFMLKNRGKVIPTERILSYVWGDKPVGDEVVRAYIKELRKILPQGSIETYRGRGYMLR